MTTARGFEVTPVLAMNGIHAQVVDYRWDRQERILEQQDEYILRYRQYPSKVSVSATLEEGRIQSFGSLMFFPAGTKVQTTAALASERTRNVICRFNADWFKRFLPDRKAWNSDDLARCYDLRNTRIEKAMHALGMEAISPSFGSEMLAESLATIIAIELARHYSAEKMQLRARTFDGQFSAEEMGKICEFVDTAADGGLTSERVASNFGVSAAHFRRSFKKTAGQTFHQYVADSRLKRAQALLTDTDLPLKEVSFRLGFANSSTFSSTFKKSCGETPNAYRLRQRGHI